MTYTTDRPTVAGWYWWRGSISTRIVTVVPSKDDPDAMTIKELDGAHCEYAGGEWCGPIPEPDAAPAGRVVVDEVVTARDTERDSYWKSVVNRLVASGVLIHDRVRVVVTTEPAAGG